MVKSLVKICGVAIGTHAIPVLSKPGPVKPVVRIIRMVGKGIPLFFDIIPGNGQALKPSPVKGNKVLLQR